EDVLVDLVGVRGDPFSRQEKERIERVVVRPRETLFRGPVVFLQLLGARLPFQVMPQFMGERLPRLGAPVEIGALACQRPEGSMVENDAGGCRIGPGFERNAFAQGIDALSLGMRHRAGAYLEPDDS